MTTESSGDDSRLPRSATGAEALLDAERIGDKNLIAKLTMAVCYYEQATDANDWETADRGIRHAREMVDMAQRHIADSVSTDHDDQRRIFKRCSSLRAEIDLTSSALQDRMPRQAHEQPASNSPP